MNEAIVVEDLEKAYGSHRAVAGISFSVGAGEIVGLLGPNGAGKTTTIEILEGLRRRDSGSVRVLGRDPEQRELRLNALVGVVPQSSGIDGELTVRETVKLYTSFYRDRALVSEILRDVGLEECERARLSTLSGGQRRRVDLALALVGNPRVLFLDEPTTGLDPAARRRIWAVISSRRALGVAVLLTSHYLDEVQHLADRVVVMRGGRIVANDTPAGIVGTSGRVVVISFHATSANLPSGPWHCESLGNGTVELTTEDPTDSMRMLLDWAAEVGIDLENLEVRQRSLEERYLELTGDE
jgi:ABC-2 type transport system ATP-binding protein